MNKQRFLGIHHRIDGQLAAAFKQALDLGANCMQIFVSSCKSGKIFEYAKHDLDEYFRLRSAHPDFRVFVHASFCLSLTTSRKDVLANSKRIITNELGMADLIKAEFLVVHPGSSKDQPKTSNDLYGIAAGIQTMVKTLTELAEKKFNTQILIENTAYGKANVCSNLQDFRALRDLLPPDNNIGFCLDLAHAFAYGYAINPVEEFVRLLDNTMGLENIKLVHLNDSATKQASKIDQHKIPGQGFIGEKALRDFVQHQATRAIPNILELPLGDFEEALKAVQFVKNWF